MQAPSECERQGAGEGVVHDEVDVKAAEHVAGLHMTCTDHTGRRFAGERPRGNAFPEQSICSPRRSAAAVPVTDAGAMTASRMVTTEHSGRCALVSRLACCAAALRDATNAAGSRWRCSRSIQLSYASVCSSPRGAAIQRIMQRLCIILYIKLYSKMRRNGRYTSYTAYTPRPG